MASCPRVRRHDQEPGAAPRQRAGRQLSGREHELRQRRVSCTSTATDQNCSLQYSTAGRARGHNTANAVNAFTVAATAAAEAEDLAAPRRPVPGSLHQRRQGRKSFPTTARVASSSTPTARPSRPTTLPLAAAGCSPSRTSPRRTACTTSVTGSTAPTRSSGPAAPRRTRVRWPRLLMSYRPTYSPAQIAAALRGGTVQTTNPGAGNRNSGAGILLAPNIFQVVNTPPSILSVSPANGPAGTAVTITGINLSTTVNVTFNGVPASFQIVVGHGPDGDGPGGRDHGTDRRPDGGRGGVQRGEFHPDGVRRDAGHHQRRDRLGAGGQPVQLPDHRDQRPGELRRFRLCRRASASTRRRV